MNDTEKMDIVVQASGIDTTNQQFKELINTIVSVTSQVGKLSSKVSGLMRNFSKLSETTQPNKKSYSGKSIIKNANNRLNVGDVSNWYSGKVYNQTYKLYKEDLSKVNKEIEDLTINSAKSSRQIKTFNQDINNSGKNSESASDKLWKFAKNVKTLTYSIYMAKRLASIMNSLVQASGTWIENLNLFAVTFGESNYRDALSWATDYAEKLGVANNEIVQMTGYFKQLSTAIGITGEQGDQLSQILVQLGYDFGSFYNISFGSAFEKLQSGIFSGQVRTLRTIGIDVSQMAIQNLLDTNSVLSNLNASATQLTQTQKVLARTILTMQAGTNAFGDLARSMDTLQNRVRILQASFDNLKLALGDLVSEYAREFVAYGIAITKVITNIIRVIKPLQTELTYDIGDTVFTEITDEAEETSEAINQLPFDKFISLTSGDDEQVNLTEALNQLLQEQIEKYETISSQFDGIDERVQEITKGILSWVFPNTTLDELKEITEGMTTGERFKVVLEELNPVLSNILNTLIGFFKILSQIFEIVKVFAPALSNIISAILSIVNVFVQVISQLRLIYPILVAIIGLKIANSISTLIINFGKMGSAFKQVIAWFQNYNLQCALATTKTQILLQSIGSLTIGVLSVIGSIVSLIANWDNMSTTAKALTIVVATLTAVVAGLASAKYFLMGNWAKGLAVAGAVIATGATVMTAISGFEDGGIPAKSELFYMNENGVPEALINTGGSQTNVINIDQLAEGMRRGFVEAIYDTGLNNANNITLKIDKNINDSAFARAIFPALKVESKNRGGNQL